MRKVKMIKNVSLKENQEKVLDYLIKQAEVEGTYTIDIVNQEITDNCNFSSRTTTGNILNNLVDKNLIKKLGSSTVVLNNEYFRFVENKTDTAFTTDKLDVSVSAEEFLPVSEWLQDVATAEDNQSYCVAYRTLRDSKNCFTDNEKLVAKRYLIDKVNKYGTGAVVDRINRTCNATDITEIISLIA